MGVGPQVGGMEGVCARGYEGAKGALEGGSLRGGELAGMGSTMGLSVTEVGEDALTDVLTDECEVGGCVDADGAFGFEKGTGVAAGVFLLADSFEG